MTTRTDFAGHTYDPIAAPLLGVRLFTLGLGDPNGNGLAATDELGTLHGAFMQRHRWTPGTNHSTCYPRPYRTGNLPTHDFHPDCDCGFWAYTNGASFIHVFTPAVLGVIEGSGRGEIGPKGFRTQTARIVAVAFPPHPRRRRPMHPQVTIEDPVAFAAELEGMPTAAARRCWELAAMTAKRLKSVVDPTDNPPPQALGRQPRPWEDLPPHLRHATAARYPNTAVYDTVTEMLTAHPPTDLTTLLQEDTPT